MKKLYVAFACFLTVLGIVIGCKSDNPLKYSTPTAVGSIMLPSDSDIAFDDIYVRVEETGKQYTVSEDGTWNVQGLEEGSTYTLYFQNKPFLDVTRGLSKSTEKIYSARKTGVIAAPGNGADNGIVQLKIGAAISGTVKTRDGLPLSDAAAYIPDSPYITQTDSDGRFTLEGIPSGIYPIGVSKQGYTETILDEITVIAEDDEIRTYEIPTPVELASSLGSIQGSVYFEGSTSIGKRTATVTAENTSVLGSARTVTTNESGVFLIDNLPAGDYKVTVSTTSSYQPHTIDNVSVGVSSSVILDPVYLRAIGGTMSGRVSTSDGSSPASATILLSSISSDEQYLGTVNDDGSYIIENIIAGDYVCTVSMDGFVSIIDNVKITQGKVLTNNIDLIAVNGTIIGRVVLRGAANNSGVTIIAENLDNPSYTHSTSTQDYGTFTISGIRKEGNYQVRISKDGYASYTSETINVISGDQASIGTVTLEPLDASLSGNITLRGASSYRGIEVVIESSGITYDTTTDSAGDFFFPHIPAGTYTMVVSYPGYVTRTLNPILVSQSEVKVLDNLVLEIAVLPFSGHVTLEGADDYSGVTVSAVNMVDGDIVYAAETDESGYYSIDGMEPGAYVIAFSKAGYLTYTTTAVVAAGVEGKADADLEIGTSIITGRVYLDGASSYDGITVTAMNMADSNDTYSTVTGTDGSFSIVDIKKEGTYQLKAEKEEYASEFLEQVKVVFGFVNQVDSITLQKINGNVFGTVVLEGSYYHEGIDITLSNDDNSYSATTDSDGVFDIPSVVPGTYTLTASKDGYGSKTINGVSVIQSKNTEIGKISLVLDYQSISGAVTLEDMVDASGVLVVVTSKDGNRTYNTTTSYDGSFAIGQVTPGTYTVEFSKEGYLTSSKTVVVQAGSPAKVEAELFLGSSIITGKIMLEGAESYEGITVRATFAADSNISYEVQTEEDGAFSIVNIEREGNYRIAASYDGYQSYSSGNIAVEFGEVVTVPDVTLISVLGSVTGSVKLEGVLYHDEIAITLKNDGNEYTATTGVDGSFTVPSVKPGTYTLTASKDGYVASTTENVIVTQGKETAISSVILPYSRLTLSGMIIQGDDTTLITITSATAENIKHSAYADYSGAFTISGIVPGTYRIVITNKGYLEYSDTITIAAGTNPTYEAKLVPMAGSISGTILLEGAKDYSDIQVVAVDSNTGMDRYSTETLSDGSYYIAGITSEGLYIINALKDGYANDNSTSVNVVYGEKTVVDTITLVKTSAVVKGIAELENRSSHSAITVQLSNEEGNEYETTTDSSGFYAFTGVVPGEYILTISKGGYTEKTVNPVTVLQSGTIEIEKVVLTEMVLPFSGHVRLEGTEDYSGVLVTATNLSDNKVVYSTYTEEDGSYSFESMMAGSYEIRFSKAGYLTWTTEVSVVFGTAGALDAELSLDSGAITGYVLLENQTEHSGISVVAFNSGNEEESYNATTAEDGSFTISGIKNTGRYVITASKDGYTPDNSHFAEVILGKISSIGTFTLSDFNSTVKGKVELSGAAIHNGVSIVLQEKDGDLQYTATTDDDGEYIISDVVPDKYYIVRASKEGYTAKSSASTYVSSSSDTEIPLITLTVSRISIRGTVHLEGEETHSSAVVTAVNVEDASIVYTGITSSSGAFSLAGMIAGEYIISISKDGYRTITLETVNIETDSSTINLKTIELPRAVGTITGVARLEGSTDHSGITVSLVGTEYTAVTNNDGVYEMIVPPDTYTGGLRFTRDDYELQSLVEIIPVITDSIYTITTNVQLNCLASTVTGRIDVLGTDDDSAVTVSIEGTDFSAVTESDGIFTIEHVPLGNYTLLIQHPNASIVSKQFAVEAGLTNDLGTISVIPNAATLTGKVLLDGMVDNSGITVTAECIDGEVESLSAVTNKDGSFYIGNVITGYNYTVSFVKDGWVSDTIERVTDLEPLEERNLTPEGAITLYDTEAPVLSSVTINDGANTSSEAVVEIHLEATDLGSGLKKMQYCFDNRFDNTVTMRDYSDAFTVELPEENGDKTIYVKVYDASGNASEIASATVTLVDQVKGVEGPLSDDELHWTKDKSPYLVTGNILVPEGSTLIIDPGVDVQFNGAYYIQIEGTLQAVGSETERIKFYGVNDGLDRWLGLRFINNNNSVLDYVDYYDADEGISGAVVITNSTLEFNDIDSRAFSGTIKKSELNIKSIKLGDTTYMEDVVISGRGSGVGSITIGSNSHPSFINCTIQDVGSITTDVIASSSYYLFINCTIQDVGSITDDDTISYLFINCTIQDVGSITSDDSSFSFINCILERVNEFKALKSYLSIVNSNIIGCGSFDIAIARSEYETLDFRNNFWDYDKTREFNESKDGDVSFINDYYDDFNLSRVDYSGYVEEPLEDVGVLDEGYMPPELPEEVVFNLGDIGPGGGKIVYVDTDDEYPDWEYIEAISTRFTLPFGYYRTSDSGVYEKVGTSADVGAGKANTEALVNAMGDYAYTSSSGSAKGMYAAKFASMVNAGGYDWYLPSSGDNELIGSSGWSSTEYSATQAYYSSSRIDDKDEKRSVTIIRYF